MDKKRIIFSVDGTLVQTHREPLQEFLEQEAQGSGEYFKNHFPDILADYETRFSVYNKDQLLWHLNRYSKQKLTPRFLEDLFLICRNRRCVRAQIFSLAHRRGGKN